MKSISVRGNGDIPDRSSAGLARRIGVWWLHEMREILPPTLFFAVGFNLVVLTTNLIAFASFMLATAAALVLAPVRSRSGSLADLVQDGFLLGRGVHRPPSRTFYQVLAN
jgi:hypothetical protein